MKSKTTKKKTIVKKPAAKKPVAKKPLTQKVSQPKVVAKKPVAKMEVKHQDVKSCDYHGKSGDCMFDILRTYGIPDLFIVILKIIILGTIISLAFSYGGDDIGVVSIGAIVTAYGALSCKYHKDHSKPGVCIKTLITGAVIGAISTWVCMVIGSIIADQSGYVIGIIIGITVALRLAPIVTSKI